MDCTSRWSLVRAGRLGLRLARARRAGDPERTRTGRAVGAAARGLRVATGLDMTGGAGRGEAMATGAAVRVVTGTWNPGTCCIPSTSTQTVTVTSSVAMDATMMVISRRVRSSSLMADLIRNTAAITAAGHPA